MTLKQYILEVKDNHKFLETEDSALQWAIEHLDDIGEPFEILQDEEELSDFQIANEEFKKEEYEDRASEYSYKYNELMNDDEVEIYRMIAVNSINDINFNDIGMHWSFEKDGAGVYGDIVTSTGEEPKYTKGSKEILLTGIVNPKDIDWEYGFTSFMYYGEDQWECALNKNTKILITHINEKELNKPIEAKTDIT